MADDAGGGSSPLDKYIILAQMDSCVESALIMNIERALRDKATFFVGELLKLPKVQALAGGPHKKHFHLLELFAHGTYPDFKADTAKFPAVDEAVVKKLKMLTVVSMASDEKVSASPAGLHSTGSGWKGAGGWADLSLFFFSFFSPRLINSPETLPLPLSDVHTHAHTHAHTPQFLDYSTLMQALDIHTVRDLEDLLIDCIYAGVIDGRMDQQAKQLQVQRALGRDVSDLDIGAMCEKLEQWSRMCDHMIDSVTASTKQAENCFKLDKMRKQELKSQLTTSKAEVSKEMNGRGAPTRASGGIAGSLEDADLQRALQASALQASQASRRVK
jgi:hypothetical protein